MQIHLQLYPSNVTVFRQHTIPSDNVQLPKQTGGNPDSTLGL